MTLNENNNNIVRKSQGLVGRNSKIGKEIKETKVDKEALEKQAKELSVIKLKKENEFYLDIWKDGGLPNPFEIARDFVQEKGLKIYGGFAIHQHLKQFKNPIYDEFEFPDYDVFSPDAWNHSKEICNLLDKMGYDFVEAKASILNNDKHQTYKISVDMVYILDITQAGCLPDDLKDNDCSKCGLDKNGKCFSFFNSIPVNDLNNYNKDDIYYETYDYKKKKSKYPKKLLVCSADWLKISLYLEMSQPLNDPTRFVKIKTRLTKLESIFDFDHKKCIVSLNNNNKNKNNNQLNQKISEPQKKILDLVYEFLHDNKKVIHYGSFAINMFLKNKIPVVDFEVYTSYLDYYSTELMKLLKETYKYKYKFIKEERITYWKELDKYSIFIYVVINNKKHLLVTFTDYDTCMPYLTYKGDKFITIDRLKFLLYRGISTPELTKITDVSPKNYECILSEVLATEENKLEKDDNIRGRYKSNISRCMGDELNMKQDALIDKWIEKNEFLKKTVYYMNFPKKNMLTKTIPLESEFVSQIYRPNQEKLKVIEHKSKLCKKKKRKVSKKKKFKFKEKFK